MSNRELFFAEMKKAIHLYRLNQLSLNGLVSRLEELAEAISNTGVEWRLNMDDCLLQLEIINSLILSGDMSELSLDDLRDIKEYLTSIEIEIDSQMQKKRGAE